MSDIVWDDKFRLTVARRIAMLLADPGHGFTPREIERVFIILAVVCRRPVWLNENVQRIETALGTTLQKVREEMGRNGK